MRREADVYTPSRFAGEDFRNPSEAAMIEEI
jgi:hypothetical protein